MFGLFGKNYLGFDIGASSIRIVELSGTKESAKLINYGEIESAGNFSSPFMSLDQSNLFLAEENVTRAIKEVLHQMKTKSREAIFSLPDFSTFFVTFDLPKMDEAKELPQAVSFEAKKYIPIPMRNITLDWQIIENFKKEDGSEFFKILTVAIPNEVIDQYQRVATNCQLKLLGFEPEAFGLYRSLAKGYSKPVCIIDVGMNSTTINIADENTVKLSHSINFSGNQITQAVAKGMSLSIEQADSLKIQQGLSGSDAKVKDIILPSVNMLVQEVDRTFREFQREAHKDVCKIILSGSTAFMPGFLEHLATQFKCDDKSEIANPFLKLNYPTQLKDKLITMGPRYAVAVGMALRGTEL